MMRSRLAKFNTTFTFALASKGVAYGTAKIIPAKKLLQRVRKIQILPHITENVKRTDEESGVAQEILVNSQKKILGEVSTSKIITHYRELKKEYPGHLIMMQVGDFFEVFDEDAERVSRILEIGLCNNRYGTQMTGFPTRSIDLYLEKLVKAGLSAVIVEQDDSEMSKSNAIIRKVTRIVTPGTLTEDSLLKSNLNNFILALEEAEEVGMYGFAWIDLSTGYFRVMEVAEKDVYGDLVRINPTEIIAEKQVENLEALCKFLRSNRAMFSASSTAATDKEKKLLDGFLGESEDFGSALAQFTNLERRAASRVITYIFKTQLDKRPYMEVPQRYSKKSFMKLDTSAIRSLELSRNNSTNTKENSLLDVLDETCTAAGSRLLLQRLSSPLLDVQEINERLDRIEMLVQAPVLTEEIRELLRGCRDVERSFQRLALGRSTGGPRDMLIIGQTLKMVGRIKTLVAEQFPWIINNIDECSDVTDELKRALMETVPCRAADGGLIRPGYSKNLDALRDGSLSLEKTRDSLVSKYMRETKKKSLKLTIRKTLGLLLEVNKSDGPIDDLRFILDSVVADKYRYRTTELEALNTRFNDSGEDALQEELLIYEKLRQMIISAGKRIMRTAANIAELDVTASVAARANKRSYIRPILSNNKGLLIINGRHPVVEERHLDNGRSFVANDCDLGKDKHFALITGPNMGGKSTFLRQNAIISIMAQCGMFVPAEYAEIGICDAIYTRIGASDDLARDRSTFMVEMCETADILRNATEKSLVVMDEIGRGTSAEEGFILAQGICCYLYKLSCRTLFATHYTGLAGIMSKMGMMGVQMLMTSAEMVEGNLCFSHQVLPGVAEGSHAVDVARMAGIPQEVLDHCRLH